MVQSSNKNRCSKCGGEMAEGFLNVRGLIDPTPNEPRLVFVVPGEPTAANPVTAFRQGTQGLKANEAYLLRGNRCSSCGAVELVAIEETTWEP